ncbi:8-oxo-dGTP pyrophosphatase MutT (NUDIX family) [Micromonospora echinospora]|uniref:8-oxo-dGTP pyrophosphatase MutT (NUDIX family) n=1 Tax=Micromonospora echinospora TaxID=1877 RepID=A0ABR6M4Z7_MICEC|nr:NUDIX domain-containing protein [Micromonospora echinospora]MBB5110458.1 8-oxo-dGTP pyrophosphatase MutT (NUDIX family) [Micromonospora echinospora]
MLTRQEPRAIVADLVRRVVPYDRQEALDQQAMTGWVRSGEPLFRRHAPADPPRHLAVYFALLDERERSVMLVDHLKANCWLLPGGHVDEDEDPRHTVVREAAEELGVLADFHSRFGDDPFFLSRTWTRGHHSHVDMTLWFILEARRTDPVRPDPREFRSVRWYGLTEVNWNSDVYDPQMHRFVAKLDAWLARTADYTPT